MKGVAGSASLLTRVTLEGGLFCVKGRATQVTGVIIARQSNITSPIKPISDLLYYRTTIVYSNFLTLRTLSRVWLEDRLCTCLPTFHMGTITENVAGSLSLPSPLTRIPRVTLEGGVFCVKRRTAQVAGVIIARQSLVKCISD